MYMYIYIYTHTRHLYNYRNYVYIYIHTCYELSTNCPKKKQTTINTNKSWSNYTIPPIHIDPAEQRFGRKPSPMSDDKWMVKYNPLMIMAFGFTTSCRTNPRIVVEEIYIHVLSMYLPSNDRCRKLACVDHFPNRKPTCLSTSMLPQGYYTN